MKKKIIKLIELKEAQLSLIQTELEKAEKGKRKVKELKKNEIETSSQLKILEYLLCEDAIKWWNDKSKKETKKLIKKYGLTKPIRNRDIFKVWIKNMIQN